MDYRLALDYKLTPGWLAPWFNALRLGKATGRRCSDCGSVSIAPLRVCTCGSDTGEWCELSGNAEILFRTSGADGAFALVRFDGANTSTVVRLDDRHATSRRASLLKPATNDLRTTVRSLPASPSYNDSTTTTQEGQS